MLYLKYNCCFVLFFLTPIRIYFSIVMHSLGWYIFSLLRLGISRCWHDFILDILQHLWLFLFSFPALSPYSISRSSVSLSFWLCCAPYYWYLPWNPTFSYWECTTLAILPHRLFASLLLVLRSTSSPLQATESENIRGPTWECCVWAEGDLHCAEQPRVQTWVYAECTERGWRGPSLL